MHFYKINTIKKSFPIPRIPTITSLLVFFCNKIFISLNKSVTGGVCYPNASSWHQGWCVSSNKNVFRSTSNCLLRIFTQSFLIRSGWRLCVHLHTRLSLCKKTQSDHALKSAEFLLRLQSQRRRRKGFFYMSRDVFKNYIKYVSQNETFIIACTRPSASSSLREDSFLETCNPVVSSLDTVFICDQMHLSAKGKKTKTFLRATEVSYWY